MFKLNACSVCLISSLVIIMVFIGGSGKAIEAASDIKSIETTSDDQTAVSVTVYNSGSGLVRDVRQIGFPTGMVELKFMDVAGGINPTSVHFVSLTNPTGIQVWEQNYEFDLVSKSKLLEKYIGKEISFKEYDEETKAYDVKKGVLLSTADIMPAPSGRQDEYNDMYAMKDILNPGEGSYVVKIGDQIHIKSLSEIILPELPEGLITRPTLVWLLDVAGNPKHDVEMSYLTDGLNWNANYVAVVNENDTKLDMNGWVTINNTSGASYKNANLKLVAGDIHRVKPEMDYERDMIRGGGYGGGMSTGFQEKPFFEYRLYTLQRPATIKNNQQKQISLLEAGGIPVKKLFVFDPGRDYGYGGDTQKGKIQVKLEFRNSKENGVGIPLPKGIVRVYKADTDKSLQLIGEDSIDHTPKDENVRLFLGEAFDITGERKMKNRRQISDRIWEYDMEITLRNHKTEAVNINIIDHVSWGDWTVITSSTDWNKKDASTLEFPVKVEKDGEVKVTYTVRREY